MARPSLSSVSFSKFDPLPHCSWKRPKLDGDKEPFENSRFYLLAVIALLYSRPRLFYPDRLAWVKENGRRFGAMVRRKATPNRCVLMFEMENK
jgi:hypothetical protein